MSRSSRNYQLNKRRGSKCHHKMMTPKQKAKRDKIYLYETRRQSNLKRIKVERQQLRERG
ncbi:hypothetical protein F353_gp34 [Vibrio phage CP-T1]|uniref:hypothetical protein n=1 Tax=Vibrio phage CP-T1 TaxID=10689 RepID=UPI0002536CDB|nr:hypothetical protein F353_gp34 [Vibrio phage CP-T1]YP_007006418.1 hypothetical protein F397_gp29 [Vibrio phage vB_VchM-138]AFC22416.1 hypothetical protein CP-T1_0034 [Vibrio phage CP-T1]AFC22708.1 hypothetical protein VchM-138_0029 [Vibrio phage vB_VchM-138]AIA08730.1 hypothetical protein SBVc24_0041 [Vibrio phage 24]